MASAGEPGPTSRVLDAVEGAAPVQAVEAATRVVARRTGASEVSLLISDISGRALVRLTHVAAGEGDDDADGTRSTARERATTVPLEDGPLLRAVREQSVQVLAPGRWAHAGEGDERSWVLLAPVIERGEALGVLELHLPGEPEETLVREVAEAAHLLAFALIASRRHTDVFEWGQRTASFSLSAEIQRRLLPAASTCEGGAFTLAGWLEPAESVGGDTFDYSVGRDTLHLSMTDARGHGVASALTATLCVGALRHSRRQGRTLAEQAGDAGEAMRQHPDTSGEEFCTGLLARLDLPTGVLSVIDAGHPPPYLVREGEVRRLDLPAQLPFGLMASSVYEPTEVPLHPGDRLVLVTDGMLERDAARLDLPSLVHETRSLHPREATRALADLVLEAVGHELADDATLLVLDWHGGHGLDRDTRAGAAAPT